MDVEQRLKSLEDLVKKQQQEISCLNEQVKSLNEESVTISDEMYRSGRNGYPSLYDVKEKMIEKGWLKKP